MNRSHKKKYGQLLTSGKKPIPGTSPFDPWEHIGLAKTLVPRMLNRKTHQEKDDCIQEAMIGIWKGGKSYNGKGAKSSHLLGYIKESVRQHLRKTIHPYITPSNVVYKTHATTAQYQPYHGGTTMDPLRKYNRQQIWNLLAAKIPDPKKRQCFFLSVKDRIGYREIGNIMGVSRGTVNNIISEVCEDLKKTFNRSILHDAIS